MTNIRYTTFSIIGFCFVVAFSFFWISPINFPADDGYFYLQIAHNISLGKGSSFHNLSETNGYHPLWMLVCTVLAFISGCDKETQYVCTVFTQTLLFATAIYVLLKNQSLEASIIVSLVLGIVFLGVGTLYLSEAFLALLFCSIFINIWSNEKNTWIVGLVAGLWILARLDAIFFVGAYALCEWRYFKPSLPNWIYRWFISAILLIIYLLFNYLYFGHYMPVSGMIKQGLIVPESIFDFFGIEPTMILLSIFCLILFRKNHKTKFALALGSLIHSSYTFFYISASGMWYWVPEYVLLALTLGYIAQKICSMQRFYWLALTSLLIVPATSFLKAKTQLLPHHWLMGKEPMTANQEIPNLCTQLEKCLPQRGRLLVYDSPGRLAWYSSMNIIPTDGLVNHYKYGQELAQNGILKWMLDRGIFYILAPMPADGQEPYHSNGLEIYFKNKQFYLTIHAPLVNKNVKTTLDLDMVANKFKSPLTPWYPEYPTLALWKVQELR